MSGRFTENVMKVTLTQNKLRDKFRCGTQSFHFVAARKLKGNVMHLRNLRTTASIFLLLASWGAKTGLAQSTSGSIAGSVVDPNVAAVVGAKVTVTEQDRKFFFTALTNETGHFAFAQTPPGSYAIEVES